MGRGYLGIIIWDLLLQAFFVHIKVGVVACEY